MHYQSDVEPPTIFPKILVISGLLRRYKQLGLYYYSEYGIEYERKHDNCLPECSQRKSGTVTLRM